MFDFLREHERILHGALLTHLRYSKEISAEIALARLNLEIKFNFFLIKKSTRKS